MDKNATYDAADCCFILPRMMEKEEHAFRKSFFAKLYTGKIYADGEFELNKTLQLSKAP